MLQKGCQLPQNVYLNRYFQKKSVIGSQVWCQLQTVKDFQFESEHALCHDFSGRDFFQKQKPFPCTVIGWCVCCWIYWVHIGSDNRNSRFKMILKLILCYESSKLSLERVYQIASVVYAKDESSMLHETVRPLKVLV